MPPTDSTPPPPEPRAKTARPRFTRQVKRGVVVLRDLSSDSLFVSGRLDQLCRRERLAFARAMAFIDALAEELADVEARAEAKRVERAERRAALGLDLPGVDRAKAERELRAMLKQTPSTGDNK
jgi:hypothetical protein